VKKAPKEKIAVLGHDDDEVNARVRQLREDGATARGLVARFWNDEVEKGFAKFHVIGDGADELQERVEAAYAAAGIAVEVETAERTEAADKSRRGRKKADKAPDTDAE
jgi:hypothetical protein